MVGYRILLKTSFGEDALWDSQFDLEGSWGDLGDAEGGGGDASALAIADGANVVVVVVHDIGGSGFGRRNERFGRKRKGEMD